MNRNKKLVLIFIGIVSVLALIATIIILKSNGNSETSDLIIKDNVRVISEDTETEFQPISIDDSKIVFYNNPGYEVGDVVVAGIIDTAPNGFIRKIKEIKVENGQYIFDTEYAVLTDVFEEAHIIKTFAVTDESVKDMEDIGNSVMTLDLSSSSEGFIQTLAYSELSNATPHETSTVKIKPSENGLGVVVELADEIGESLELKGDVEVNTYFELKINIEDGETNFGIAVHTNTKGELFVGYQDELFDKDDKDKFNGEYEKELLSKALPNIQFLIGPVPIVITNDFELSAKISAQLEGQIGTTVGVSAERVSGFEYSSETGRIKEINENKYLSDGMDWRTEARATGELEAGVYVHLITKLYGSTGADLSAGIAGNVDGELALGMDEKLSPTLYGNLALSIGPKASGKIVVTVPVVDYDLMEAEIFKVMLPAFWEKEWKIPDPMLIAMQNGNFSCFAGTYIATPESNRAYGGGEKLKPLELKNDGSLSGGGSYFYEDIYPKDVPISIEIQEDGSYLCKFYEYYEHTGSENDDNYNSSYRACYYIIYPVGVIEQRDYVLENQPYLKNVVYIRCLVFDGGVSDITYYSDSIDRVQ